MDKIELVKVDSTFSPELLADFCRSAENDSKQPGSKNIELTNWRQNPASLLYNIYIEKRFDKNAGYKLAIIDGEPAAGGGFSALGDYPEIALMSVRTYTNPKFRSKFLHSKILVPSALQDAREMGFKAALFCFNEYNVRFMNVVKHCIEVYPDKYGEWNTYPTLKNVRYTSQHVMYQLFDDTYETNLLDILNNSDNLK